MREQRTGVAFSNHEPVILLYLHAREEITFGSIDSAICGTLQLSLLPRSRNDPTSTFAFPSPKYWIRSVEMFYVCCLYANVSQVHVDANKCVSTRCCYSAVTRRQQSKSNLIQIRLETNIFILLQMSDSWRHRSGVTLNIVARLQ